MLKEKESLLKEKKGHPWAFWPTVGFSIIILLAGITIQMIFFLFVLLTEYSIAVSDIDQFINNLASNGLYFSISSLLFAPVTIGLTILFTWIRKGFKVKEYLFLNKIGFKRIFKWCLISIFLSLSFDTFSYLLKQPIIPEYFLNILKSSYPPPLLWVAFLIASPLSNEILFRGFIFKGIQYSKLGNMGAIIFPAFISGTIYYFGCGFYWGAFAFLFGLFLGYSVLKTNSILTPILMQVIDNLILLIKFTFIF